MAIGLKNASGTFQSKMSGFSRPSERLYACKWLYYIAALLVVLKRHMEYRGTTFATSEEADLSAIIANFRADGDLYRAPRGCGRIRYACRALYQESTMQKAITGVFFLTKKYVRF